MSKQLPTDGITNELAGSSVFFPQPTKAGSLPKRDQVRVDEQSSAKKHNGTPRATTVSPQEETVIPTNHDTVVSRNHDTTPPTKQATLVTELEPGDVGLLEEVRKATRQLGKEAATHRFTTAEKRAIADIVYTHGCQGIKTSENEITRIAVNWLLLDYQRHGALSVLAQLLDSLHG